MQHFLRSDLNLDDMKVYYINLDSYVERREKMENLLEKAALHATRYSAADDRDVSSGDFDKDYVIPQGIKEETVARLKGEGKLDEFLNKTVACAMSHIKTLELASSELRKAEQLALIMEDDIDVPMNWSGVVSRAVLEAPEDWALIKLSGWGQSRQKDVVKHQKHSGGLSFYHLKPPFWSGSMLKPFPYYGGSGAYIVRGSSVGKVLQHLRSQPLTDFDEMLLSPNNTGFYEVRPHLLFLRADHSFSAIHPTNPIVSMGAYLIRSVVDLFF
jgi:GR25 family glycosyltransferase involved in LPS biosynthesis